MVRWHVDGWHDIQSNKNKQKFDIYSENLQQLTRRDDIVLASLNYCNCNKILDQTGNFTPVFIRTQLENT